MKEIKASNRFKKDLKRYANQPRKIDELYGFINKYLRTGIPIPAEYNPHRLIGNYKGYMECHIQSDFLLIWIDESSNIVKLIRLGTHSELF